MIDWTRLLTTLAATGITAVLGTLITMLVRISNDLKTMRKRGEDRVHENRLLFKGMLGLIDAVRTGKCNGNISQVEEEIKEYLNETAIQ
jgi:hypothetical protein